MKAKEMCQTESRYSEPAHYEGRTISNKMRIKDFGEAGLSR